MMVPLLEIVRLRLRQQVPLDTHPDDNLLAGFVEGALTVHLRTRVLRHLFTCPACRALVAIAQPELMSVTKPAVAVQWYWPRWASLRWANALVAAVVIVGAVWIAHVEVKTMLRPAHVQLEVATAGTGDGSKRGTGPSVTRPPLIEGKRDFGKRTTQSSAPIHEPVTVAGLRKPGSGIAARSKLASDPLASLAPAAPTTNQLNPGLANNRDDGDFPFSVVGIGSPSWSAAMRQEKISPSVAIGSRASASLPSSVPNHTRWMVSGAGVLYQSFDDGARWQSVAIREDLRVRSVSFLGDDIWVGGNGGALYHSGDGGRHWLQMVPSFHGVALADDVERVEFTDATHGSVTTASGNTWVTADQGQTWATQ